MAARTAQLAVEKQKTEDLLSSKTLNYLRTIPTSRDLINNNIILHSVLS